MPCSYCGETGFKDNDEWIDHFIAKHTTVIPAADVAVIHERLRADFDKISDRIPFGISESILNTLADEAMFQVEHLVAEQFPPASATSQMDIPLTEEAAENMHEWLNTQCLGVSEQITEQAVSEGWATMPKAIRVTMRVEPVFDN